MKKAILHIFLGLFMLSQVWAGIGSYMTWMGEEGVDKLELLASEEKESEEKESEEKESEKEKEKDQKIKENFFSSYYTAINKKLASKERVDFRISPLLEIHLPPPELHT